MEKRANWIHRLLIVYMILQSPASGLVLCWGDCDRLAVEISDPGDRHCHGSQICDGESVYVDDAANAQASPCSACWDIPLVVHSQLDSSPSVRIQDSGIFSNAPITFLPPLLPNNPPSHAVLSEPHPPCDSIQANLQSVCLLI